MKFLLWLLLLFSMMLSLYGVPSLAAAATDTISLNQSISDGETIVSAGGYYELGFFRPSNASNRRYLGIWYKFSNQTVVWVGNSQAPLNDTSGVLQATSRGILVISNKGNLTVWSTSGNGPRQAQNPVAQLLDTGNLVVREANDSSEENYLWQSFDLLSNTLLAGAKMGKDLVTGLDHYLQSWKGDDDPSPGTAIYMLETSGYPQMLLTIGGNRVFRSGPWNGLSFEGLDELRPNSIFSYQCYYTPEEIYCEFDLVDKTTFSIMTLTNEGELLRRNWDNSTRTWNTTTRLKIDKCDSYALCGTFGVCDITNSTMCSCLEGFTPKFQTEWESGNWSGGCVRKKEFVCGREEEFQSIDGVKLPDSSKALAVRGLSLSDCQTQCKMNCSYSLFNT